MKHPTTVILTALLLASSAPAATVFTNLANPATSTVLVKGTGGFIPTAIEYGFEFTAGVGDHELTSLSVSIGTHFGSLPLTVQLFDSPAGPDSATYLTDLTGPAQPVNQVALYTPVMPVTLSGGGTYFVRFSVAGSASSYGIPTTNLAGSGTFTMGNSYQRNAGSPWGSGSALSGPMVAIEASAVPEPAGLVPAAAGFLLIVARRQRRRTVPLKRVLPVILTAAGLGAAPVVRSEVAVMDFSQLQGGLAINEQPPYLEDGIRLESMFADYSPNIFSVSSGNKALRVGINFGNSHYRISMVNGRPFTMVSVRIAPWPGVPGSTTFTGRKADNSTVTQTFSHGTSSSGTVRVFPATFQDIVALEWSPTNALSTHGYFDDFTVEPSSAIRVVPAVTLTEGSGAVSLGVTLTPPPSRPVSLTWQAVAGTATHPADYGFGGSVTGTVTVPAGAREWTIPCTIVNDTTAEAAETFTMVYNTTSAHAWMDGGVSTVVRIGNDDGVTTFAGWMSGHGLAGPDALATADPDGDGVTNVEAWLFRLNPAGPSPAAWQERRPALHIDATGRPGLRFTVPVPLPTDVRIMADEQADLGGTWSEQARRTGFGTGSLWSGSGSSRVSEVNNVGVSRTITCGASLTTRQRPRAFMRLRCEVAGGGGS